MQTTKKTVISLITILSMTFGFQMEAFAAKKGVKKGDSFPAVNLNFLGKDKKFAWKKFAGKVVVVDFWASWCTPCKVELPFLNTLYKKYRKQGFVVVGINVDDDIGPAKDFLKEHPVKFPIVYDDGKKMIDKVKVNTMPTSFILDHKGVVRHVHRGFHEEDMEKFTKQVKGLLKERNSTKVKKTAGNKKRSK